MYFGKLMIRSLKRARYYKEFAYEMFVALFFLHLKATIIGYDHFHILVDLG